MKAFVFLALLLTLSVDAAVVKSVARTNLNIGYVGYGDRLLARQYLYQPALLNTIQYQDFVYQGTRNVTITAVQATEVGYTQYASAWVIRGGPGDSNVTVRVQSYRGYGYYYLVDVWGH